MNILKIKELSNTELLDLFAIYTRVNHYDPMTTPPVVVALREEGISEDDVAAIILERMENKG